MERPSLNIETGREEASGVDANSSESSSVSPVVSPLMPLPSTPKSAPFVDRHENGYQAIEEEEQQLTTIKRQSSNGKRRKSDKGDQPDAATISDDAPAATVTDSLPEILQLHSATSNVRSTPALVRQIARQQPQTESSDNPMTMPCMKSPMSGAMGGAGRGDSTHGATFDNNTNQLATFTASRSRPLEGLLSSSSNNAVAVSLQAMSESALPTLGGGSIGGGCEYQSFSLTSAMEVDGIGGQSNNPLLPDDKGHSNQSGGELRQCCS